MVNLGIKHYISKSSSGLIIFSQLFFVTRNQEILATLMGDASQLELDRIVLTRTGFRYDYPTGTYL